MPTTVETLQRRNAIDDLTLHLQEWASIHAWSLRQQQPMQPSPEATGDFHAKATHPKKPEEGVLLYWRNAYMGETKSWTDNHKTTLNPVLENTILTGETSITYVNAIVVSCVKAIAAEQNMLILFDEKRYPTPSPDLETLIALFNRNQSKKT